MTLIRSGSITQDIGCNKEFIVILLGKNIAVIVLNGDKLHKLLLKAAGLVEEIENNGCTIINIIATGDDLGVDSGDVNQVRIYYTKYRLQ